LGLKLIAENYLFIRLMLRSLYHFTSFEKFDIIAPIVEDQDVEMIVCFIKCVVPNKNIY